MYKPLALFIGLRYTQAKRRNQFISFVSLISLLGMVLGVLALIVVLSVMNGFEAELRGRILSVLPHGHITAQPALKEWPRWQQQLAQQPGVKAAAPYVAGNIMLSRYGLLRNARLNAIDPSLEQGVWSMADHMIAGDMTQLAPGRYGIVLGDILARYLGVRPGDEVTVMLPKVTITPVGVYPRVKRFTVVAIFSVGAQLDSDTAFIHLADGQKLFQLGQAVTGLRVELEDIFSAPTLLPQLAQQLFPGAIASSWQQSQGSLFQAMKMEKTMITLLLLVIVTIAAFNIISILTMMVADKRSDIAVLRTMGMSPKAIRNIFMIQGMAVGSGGILLGIVLGLPLAFYVGEVVATVESWLGLTVFNPNVYFISKIPSLVQWQDVAIIAGAGFLLSALATIYPAMRAANIHPAEALRYE
ncbi:lipoprotein-releasing ABC transporter permease subunit [Dasania sp. GY-MA-18]|uniref:Lipoprotein-releasing ABC transporter permease subunit n=1 Tax=Dasania phycosphaerae TaxID=2950436 RepID=A0A9J6RIY4_9GAMM|nr:MULTISPECIES: lipoprotein-releasing ABC transporter permease subunit [Dasania]MCR8921901.1 lipoprotein-releasing ABC transporter permease subunit [Dasania sp. GY-MA-18]MCZ0864329.1 lipoprotein-releasing ABC transporter permease subunit [Dasania phycosphaerae]MCZ0868057.1 lipoprotein-releasing ABC transporter permease subunit [Dasania phycosphaerae]